MNPFEMYNEMHSTPIPISLGQSPRQRQWSIRRLLSADPYPDQILPPNVSCTGCTEFLHMTRTIPLVISQFTETSDSFSHWYLLQSIRHYLGLFRMSVKRSKGSCFYQMKYQRLSVWKGLVVEHPRLPRDKAQNNKTTRLGANWLFVTGEWIIGTHSDMPYLSYVAISRL